MRERDRQTDILKEMRNRKGMYKVMDKERKKIKSEKEDAGETNTEKWIKKRERQMTSESLIHLFKAKKNTTQEVVIQRV